MSGGHVNKGCSRTGIPPIGTSTMDSTPWIWEGLHVARSRRQELSGASTHVWQEELMQESDMTLYALEIVTVVWFSKVVQGYAHVSSSGR